MLESERRVTFNEDTDDDMMIADAGDATPVRELNLDETLQDENDVTMFDDNAITNRQKDAAVDTSNVQENMENIPPELDKVVPQEVLNPGTRPVVDNSHWKTVNEALQKRQSNDE